MIKITSYQKLPYDDDSGWAQYQIAIEVDGLAGHIFIEDCYVEITGVWDEAKAQAYLEANEVEVLRIAQDVLEREGLVRFNRATNEIEFPAATKIAATQTATDFLTESPAIPVDADEAWADFDNAMKQPRKSLGVGIMSTWKLIEDLRARVAELEKAKS